MAQEKVFTLEESGKGWARVLAVISKYIDYTNGTAVIIAFLASLADVTNRILGGQSMPWSHTISVWACGIFAFLTIGPGIFQHAHVGVDVLISRVGPRAKEIMTIINSSGTTFFLIINAYSAFMYVLYLMDTQLNYYLGVWVVPAWPMLVITVLLGSVIAVFYTIAYSMNELNDIGKAKELKSSPVPKE